MRRKISDTREPRKRALLEIHIGELRQLFDAMDPSPFRDRDLDPKADDYIVGWARETHSAEALSLVVHLSREGVAVESAALLRTAMHEHFARRACAARRELRNLFREGRVSLAIGLTFLVAVILGADFVASRLQNEAHKLVLMEGAFIAGWVALWHPLEIFLYAWWPILKEVRMHERLSTMEVRLVAAESEGTP